ncbi:MAG: HD domain-containing protein [Nitrospirae bacterium]|nr:HD domain-containing protein [Nitrospirota bacterium]
MSIELKKALYNISALADLGQEITSEDNFTVKIQSVLHVIMGTFVVNRGAILWYEKTKDEITFIAKRGFEDASPACWETGQIMSLEKNEPRAVSGDSVLAGAGVAILIPLWVRDEFIGAVVLGDKFSAEAYSPEDLELLKVIAHQTAITINNHALFMGLSEKLEENRKLYEEMRRIYHDTLQAFAAAIDAKDVYTKNHSHRVARYSVAIARELGWNEHDVEGIYVAGFLHDVGKLVISNELLNKRKPFTSDELHEMKRHSLLSYKIISNIRFPWKDVENIIRHHHERLDGNGYPDALTREDLSDGVKILTLADSFDAMTTERAYREKMDIRTALVELRSCLDTQFDNKIMLAFCKVLEKEIKGELPEPNILPHLDRNFELSHITALLEGLIQELSQ